MLRVPPIQVIIVRTDLINQQGQCISVGSLIAQGAKASVKSVLSNKVIIPTYGVDDVIAYQLLIPLTNILEEWINGDSTKVIMYANSEQELLDLYNEANKSDILCSLVTDTNSIEFGGVATYTCAAIGPDYPNEINKITSHLKRL